MTAIGPMPARPALSATALPAATAATFFGPANAGHKPQGSDLEISMDAGITGGKCTDATSHTAIGTACQVEVVGELPVDSSCSGKGYVEFRYFTSSGVPTVYNVAGTITIEQGRSALFNGNVLNVASGGVARATVYFLLTSNACKGAGATGSAVGTFDDAGA